MTNKYIKMNSGMFKGTLSIFQATFLHINNKQKV